LLEGKLVLLRPVELTDVDRLYRWFNDHEVIGFLSGRYPISLLREEQWIRERTKDATRMFLAIDTKEGRHIGTVGLYDIRIDDRNAALSITIGEKECWSQGYGADAIATLLRFAFGDMGLRRVWLTTLEYNERGIACYRKCGFRHEGRLRQDIFRHGRYWDFVEMGILRDEFMALHGAAREEGGTDA
jgi:ribosomal-protein-alanine N-acetyltransferase